MTFIFHTPMPGYTISAIGQMLGVIYAIAGLPCCACGISGVITKMDTQVRVYLYYLGFTTVADTLVLIIFYIFQDPCVTASGFVDLMSASLGEAYFCGVLRSSIYFVTGFALAIQIYLMWVIWSFCKWTENEQPQLSGLLAEDVVFHGADHPKSQQEKEDDLMYRAYKYAVPYGSVFTGPGILGGTTHETNFPPYPQG